MFLMAEQNLCSGWYDQVITLSATVPLIGNIIQQLIDYILTVPPIVRSALGNGNQTGV